MELLERGSFLADLGRLFDEATAGHGRLAFVGGEAGAGKTVLVERFVQNVGNRADVLFGACDALSTPRPLGPLLDMARGLGPEFERALRAGEGRDDTFRRFLARLGAGAKPTIAVFEDVHWADEATLDLLRFVARRLNDRPCLIVATYRDDELGPQHPLRLALGDLATTSTLRRLNLPRLSPDAVATLADGSGLDPHHLYRITAGNPFFVSEVLATGTGEVPASVRDAVLARFARLAEPERRALEAAAVLGATTRASDLDAVLPGATAAADACVAMGMLRAERDAFSFRHELVRDALLTVLPSQRKLELHRRTLAVLQGGGSDDLRRLAHHAEAAGEADAVLRYAPAAAEQAVAVGAHREAAAQLGRAVRFADRLPTPDRARLLERYAWACQLTDRMEDAATARRAAIELWRELREPLREGAALARLAHALVLAGRNEEGERASRGAIEVLEARPPGPELAEAYRYQGYVRMLDRDTRQAVAWSEKAVALASRHGATETLAPAYNAIGSALLVSGEVEAGRRALEHSLALAQAANAPFHVGNAYSNLGSGAGEVLELDLAERYLALAVAHDAEHDLDGDASYARSWQALVALYRGQWSTAVDLAAAVLRRPATATISRIMALVALGRVRARRGDPEIWVALDEALRLAAPTGTLQRLGPVHAARAEAAWLQDHAAEARDAARAAYELAVRKRHAWFVGELAYWRWKCGDLPVVPSGAAEPFARQMRGDPAGAAQAWNERGCPYEAARALAEANDEASLRSALATFEALGARPSAQATLRRLRELGVTGLPRGPRPSTRANPAGLTRRQLDVLRLMVEGRSNPEIALALVRSPKTVDHHVSAILAKLEVHNRTEAVREALRSGLVEAAFGSDDDA
jgi:DNA-binding CsgD family transcriptional regulator/tetratricopeptide (TPR) repeat protein